MKIYNIFKILWVSLLFLSGISFPVMAEDRDGIQRAFSGEVVFLLDGSGSMNTQDKERLTIDSIRQAAYSLPSGYRTGLVVYNTEVLLEVPLSLTGEEMDAGLESVVYGGYTNAGEGLSRALALFSDHQGTERWIVMLSDGEIDMPDPQRRETSRRLYAQASQLAKERNIKICIVAVGSERSDPQMHIFDGAELTDGAIYWEGQSGSLSRIMDRILSERFAFPRQALGVTDSNGGTVHAQLPQGVSRAKLLITSEKGIGQVTAVYRAEKGRTVTGSRFAVVDMERPGDGGVDVLFETPELSGVQAYLITEFNGKPKVSVDYRIETVPRTEREEKQQQPLEYEHFADITIEVADAEDAGTNLLAADRYEGAELSYFLNGRPFTGTLKEGRITQTIGAEGIDQVEVSVDASGLGALYYMEQPVTAEIPKTPDPVFEPAVDYRPLLTVMGMFAAAVAGLGIWWIKKSHTTVIYVAQPISAGEPAKKVETKTCTYTGKLNLYAVRTADGRDIPPQTYRLFGRSSGRITLGHILASCRIKPGNIGADDIIFYPGPQRSVIVMDQSEGCTLLRGTEILKKGMGYPVFYNEKLTISFEDEATEMEIHYKNLKPSEREIQ